MRQVIFFLVTTFVFPSLLAQMAWVGLPESQKAKLVFFAPEPGLSVVSWELTQGETHRSISCKEMAPGVFHGIAEALTPHSSYTYKVFTEKGMAFQGSFMTLNTSPTSFRFTAGACSFLHGNPVYEAMLQTGPQFYINVGDLHYGDIKSAQASDHLNGYRKHVLQGRPEQIFFAQTPLVYMWDDHDFCGNNSGGTSPCAQAAQKAYALGVPAGHLPFPEDGIHQSFVQGRVRFMLPDLRSGRAPGQLLSSIGLSWLKSELIKTHQNKEFPIVVSSVPFLGTDSDSWGGAPHQRKLLAHWLDSLFQSQALILGGDAHMSGIDDGTHSQWNPNQTQQGPIVVQAAALIGFGSDKGGTYSEGGSFPNPLGAMQFASFQVIDNGGNALAIHIQIHRLSPLKESQKILTKFSAFFPMPGPGDALGFESKKKVLTLDKEQLPATVWIRNTKGQVIHKQWITEPQMVDITTFNDGYIELQSAAEHWVRKLP